MTTATPTRKSCTDRQNSPTERAKRHARRLLDACFAVSPWHYGDPFHSATGRHAVSMAGEIAALDAAGAAADKMSLSEFSAKRHEILLAALDHAQLLSDYARALAE